MRPTLLLPLALSGCLLASYPSVDADTVATITFSPTNPRTLDEITATVVPTMDGITPEVVAVRWLVDGEDAGLDSLTVPADRTASGQTWTLQVELDGINDEPSPLQANIEIGNTPPVATDARIGPADPQVGDTITVTATVEDADDDTVGLDFIFEVNGDEVQRGTEPTLRAPLFAKGDTVAARVIPRDPSSLGEPFDAGAVTVLNTPPVVTDLRLTPAEAYVDDVLTAEATLTDADGDPLTVEYVFFVNDVEVQRGTEATLSGAFRKGERVTVAVTAADDEVTADTVTSDPLTVLNSLPVVDAVTITPAEARVEDVLTAEVETFDADRDPLTLAYDWRIDGASVQTGPDGTLRAPAFVRDDLVSVRVTPSDDEAAGLALASTGVRILNTAPVISEVSLSPSSPTVSDVVRATITATDADRDALTFTYDFRVDGTTVQDSTAPTLEAPLFAKNQDISVMVTANDRFEDSAPLASSTITSVNTPPTSPGTPSITPADPSHLDDLTCTWAASTDADDDPLTYEVIWVVDGSATTTTSVAHPTTTLTASADETADGESWACRVRTLDDDDAVGGPVTSAAVEVFNEPPSAPVVAISPAEPGDDDDLVCAITTASVDPEGQPVTYTFAWEADGVAFRGAGTTTRTGDTIDALDTEPWTDGTEAWTCTATPRDDTKTGPPGEDEVEVIGNLGVLKRIAAGSFTMGCQTSRDLPSDSGLTSCNSRELPTRAVTLTNDLYVMESEVTQKQWRDLMGTSPSFFSTCGDACPVERVNWFEALAFANAASRAEGLAECYTLSGCTGTLGGGCGTSSGCVGDYTCTSVSVPSGGPYACAGYRLPTEAEWEYAARGGESFGYAGSNKVGDVGWYSGNSGSRTRPVCGLDANGYGLCDMSGNVWEWTWDWYGTYPSSAETDPVGPGAGSSRVIRGGHWGDSPQDLRVAFRSGNAPARRDNRFGFRLVRSVP